MKRYEKIILTIFGVVFICQLFNFLGDSAFFAFSTWLLALSYFIGGYWLFRGNENRTQIITILSGIAFAIPLFNLPYLVWVRRDTYDYYLPIVNGVLFLFLIGYWIKNRESKVGFKKLKLIFIRSFSVLILTCFFTYTPISFKPYRDIIYYLNNGDKYLQSNMKMFDYSYLSEEALDNGNCDIAIKYAIEANKAGEIWLGISEEERKLWDNEEDVFLEQQRSKLRGTYGSLFDAYKCKADDYFNNKEYEKALNYYIKSNKALSSYSPKTEYWNLKHVFSINSQAVCYKKLNNYEYADSLFVKAIDEYTAIKGAEVGKDLALIYSNLADSMSDQAEYEYSNMFYKRSAKILQNDTLNEGNGKEMLKNYYGLIDNHFQTDSLKQVKLLLKKIHDKVDRSSSDFCRVNYYEGIYLYRIEKFKESDRVFSETLECFINTLKPEHQNIAEIYFVLSNVKMDLAEYDKAKKFIKLGMEITAKNYGLNSERYANYLKIDASIDKIQGNYKESETKYYKTLELYKNALGNRNSKIYDVLSSIANLEVILSRLDKAKIHSDNSMSIADDFIYFNRPTETNLINNAAYVNYYIGNYKKSDSLYRKSMDINRHFKAESRLSSIITLNGLGLLQTAKKEYKVADSLFTKALKLHDKLFLSNHPLNAIIHLNYANLKIEQNKIEEAKEMLFKSLNVNKKFIKEDHDTFADIYVALGDVSKKEKEYNLASDYYKKALEIYNQNFDSSHAKIVAIKKKI